MSIKRRTTGVLKKPELITKEFDDIIKQTNKSNDTLDGRVTTLESKTELLTGDEIPTNKTGKDGDVFIHTVTKVVYIKLGGIWS